jgi:hypothetical protein
MGFLIAMAVRMMIASGDEKLGLKVRPELLFQVCSNFIYFENRFMCAIKVS